ncbi:MAG: MATE family efflux transporter [Oscillospiraceae bacterium]
MNEQVVANPLGTERVGKLMIRYAIPSIISIVVNSLYNMVDQIFIGQGVGYLGNAATNIILPLTSILLALGMMIGDGTASYMSLNLGKGRNEDAAQGVGNAVTLAVGVSVLLLVLFELFLEPLCYLFGATEGNLPYALEYGRIIVLGFPFAMIDGAFGSIIRADGRPKVSMAGLLIGCITNIILDPIFIFVCHWGVKGAAWATIIGQVLNAVYFAACMLRFKTIEIKKQHMIPKWSVIKRILTLGTSSFISQAASVFVIAVMNNSLVKYGAMSKYGADIPLAALGITMKVSQLITGIALGIATGIQPIFGFNYGSGQYDRVKKTYKLALTSCTLILVVAFFIFQFCPEYIINLFGQESDLYMEFAVKCFRVYLLACFMIGAGAVTGIFFQAIGKPVPAALLSLSRQIIFLIPAMLLFGYLWGVEGILWAGPVGDGLSGVISLITLGAFWKKIFNKEVAEK